MDSLISSLQETHVGAPEANSAFSLLERGIACARQGSYAEGIAFFALLREQLSADLVHLAAALDAIINSNVNYWQAQQMLNLASKRFAEADVEQKNALLAIEKLLPALSEEAVQETQALHQSRAPQLSDKQIQQPQRPADLLTASQKARLPHETTGELVSPTKENGALPDLYITCFGRFEVRRFDQPIVLCHSRSGQAILRYLVAQTEYCASVDKLMDILWPQDTPEKARHKLQVAVSELRHSLNGNYHCNAGEGYIIYKEGFYRFNSTVTVRTDVDKFLSLWQTGRQASGSESAILFERACNMCIGPFLVEDTYSDWSFTRREQLKQIYFTMCRTLAGYYFEHRQYEDALKWASAVLREDRCDETAHQQLMHIYAVQGHRSETLRQYQRCKRILAEELGIEPASETVNLLQTLLINETFPLEEIERK